MRQDIRVTFSKSRKRRVKPPLTPRRASTLTAEEYRIKYLLNGNASHARLMRFARMLKRECNNAYFEVIIERLT